MRWVAATVLLLAPWLAAAETYNYLPFKMLSSEASPFPWYLDARSSSPGGLAFSEVQTATQNAWQKWDDVACSAKAFTFKGPTTALIPEPRDPYDLFNVSTLWLSNAADPYYSMAFVSNDIAALTLPLAYAGVLQQCDIYINGVDLLWSTLPTTPAGVMDLESIVLHEVGHCQGLDHSNMDPADVMYASAVIGASKRTLSNRDTQTICQRYPTTSAVGSPCLADGGCGTNPAFKCAKASGVDGGSPPVCTVGCPTGVNFQCDMPFVCGASTLFSPSFNGACLPPGSYVTQVGHPCTQSSDCGSSNGQCFKESALPSGFARWKEGYCTQDCAAGQPSCPVGSACMDFGGTAGQWCLTTCRIAGGDCRPGYTCTPTPDGSKAICVPSCHSDPDCNPPGVSIDQCRSCDGTCLAKQNPAGQVGNPCANADSCGVGQLCVKFSDSSSQAICTQPCARACSACPLGSTCHPIGARGDLYCLKDCQPHSCPAGLQCGQLSTGRGCLPPCTSDLQCPVGNQCILGECANPYENYDAGCALCPQPNDGGDRPTSGAPDAGTLPGPGSGGCGCQEGAGSAATLGALLLLLALWLRRPKRALDRKLGFGQYEAASGTKFSTRVPSATFFGVPRGWR